jgi:hypothetical protein
MWPSICDSSEDIEEEDDEDFRDTNDNLEYKYIIVYNEMSVLRGCTELYGQLHELYSFLYLPLLFY